MKLIPQCFQLFQNNINYIRCGVGILALVSFTLLLFCFPQHGDLGKYTSLDRLVTIWQIANGRQASGMFGDLSLPIQFAKVVLPLCFFWLAIEALFGIFIRFFTGIAINRFFCGHVVVLGIGEKGFSLAKELLGRGNTVVAIDKNADNPYLKQIRCRKGFALVGDATDAKFLETLGLHRAVAFYAMTGDDTINIESAILLKKYFQEQKITYWNRLWNSLCGFKTEMFAARIQVHDPILRRLTWEKGGPFSHASINENTETPWACYPFSAYDQAARVIVEEFSPDIAEGKTQPYHVVIAGFGWFGERVALQVIRMCQTPLSGKRKMVINVIDNHAELSRERFYQRYPAVNPDNADDPRYGGYAPLAKVNFIQGSIQQMDEKAVRTAIPDIDEHTIIYICLADELLGVEAAMLFAKITGDSGVRIILALPETERLSKEMQGAFDKYNINMFFPFSKSCVFIRNEKQLCETIDNMGKVVLRAYKELKNVTELEESWANVAEWERESNRQSASHVFFKLRMTGIDPKHFATIGEDEIKEKCGQHLVLLAEVEHDRWSTERLLDGWTYGQRDDDKRLRPDIQSFATLNKGTQDIDFAINEFIPQVVEVWQNAMK